MDKTTTIIVGIIIVLVVIGGLGYYFLQMNQVSNNSGQENQSINGNVINNDNNVDNTQTQTQQPSEKTFAITGQNFSFSLSEIRVSKGDKVKIIFNNASGFHDWVLDEFNVRTEQFQGPGTREVNFVADKTGTFEFYCSVGQHRKMGMKGNFIVE